MKKYIALCLLCVAGLFVCNQTYAQNVIVYQPRVVYVPKITYFSQGLHYTAYPMTYRMYGRQYVNINVNFRYVPQIRYNTYRFQRRR